MKTVDFTQHLLSIQTELFRFAFKPKSVIRISLCRTAKRNPLIFPI